MIDKNTTGYIIDGNHRIYRTKVGMFLDIFEVKVQVGDELVCRHSIEESDGEWFLRHRNGAGKIFLTSQPLASKEIAEERLFNIRLNDANEMYIQGHRPTFYTDFERLVEHIAVEFDKHTQCKILAMHTQEFGYNLYHEMEFRLGTEQLKHNMANYQQTVQLQIALNDEDLDLKTELEIVKLDGNVAYEFNKMRQQLFVVNDKLYFQGLLVELEYPKVSSKPTGPLFKRGLEAGMTEDEAGKLYQMGYKMLEVAITRI